ncbi:Candidapepsin [Purpureocillium lavendulum]|uniref:Candidapepsin n=1 Tax=Purpureocillium lavendulum TaxID=1247861 RepID=A0AB34FY93_9HYPO|nr:Candidapepsin [Purpureocillium lavendulum]
MPRLVRRRPLWERITSMLNPMDFLLWLSEEMETKDWDSKLVGTQLGLGLNFVFLLARANSGRTSARDDIFTEDTGAGWVSFLVYPLVWGLVLVSLTNAVYTICRTRKYRMFEANIDVQPSTPSAHRVKVQSSPGSPSPLRYIADMLTPESAESRAHPDKVRDVWELSVWDPLPVSIRLFCFFSPGHVLVYLLFLPLAPLDPRPSVTVFNALAMQAVLSAQLILFSSRYSQQAKDNAIIQKEVMHEYDTKFVHPRIHPIVRDVGTQMSDDQPVQAREFVQAGTPTTLIRRSFVARHNPHIDSPDSTPSIASNDASKHQIFTPPTATRRVEMLNPSINHSLSKRSPAMRSSLPAGYTPAAAQTTASVPHSVGGSQNFGGSLGVYSHNKSPLKKTISLGDINKAEQPSPRNSREMAAYEQRNWAPPSSPTKHNTTSEYLAGSIVDHRPFKTQQGIEEKKEARRQRRNLKESGDYLGVQGVNPETGQLDVITPSDSERSSTSQETQKKLNVLRDTLRDSRHSYKSSGTWKKETRQATTGNGSRQLRDIEGNKQKLKDGAQTSLEHQDGDWYAMAMKIITDKSREVMDEFASTHITTTTGHDLPAFSSTLEGDQESTQNPSGRRQLSRVIYNLPMLSPEGPELKRIARSPSQSTSPNLRDMEPAEATDTTSRHRLTPMKRRRDDIAAQLSAQPERESQRIKAGCNTSHRLTFIRPDSTTSEPLDGGTQVPIEGGELQTPTNSLGINGDLSPPTRRVSSPRRSGKGPTNAMARGPETVMEGRNTELIMASIPGAYPTALSAEDGTGDPSDGTAIDEYGLGRDDYEEKGDTWMAMRDTSHTAYSHCKSLLAVYLEIVLPVFQAGSEYWERNERQEATLMDVFALVLAMPMALLGGVMLL